MLGCDNRSMWRASLRKRRSARGSTARSGLIILIATRRDVDYLAENIKGARLEVIPGAGHLSNQENPEAFNAAVRRLLDGLG